MDKKTVGLSDTFKTNTASKGFVKNPIKGTKFTIAISSAKGGVGKSTFAMNFALALKSTGSKVGILDADIYGPSLPKMMSINNKPESKDGKSLTPIEQYGIQCMSIGFLVKLFGAVFPLKVSLNSTVFLSMLCILTCFYK